MTLTRRTFLASPFLARAAGMLAAQPDRDGAILVVLQLAGGNDGLNTVVPYDDDAYARARTTLRLTGKQVHKIGDSLGFHPELGGLARLYNDGRLTVVQGVGYPNMHRDHNIGMLSWQTASPASQPLQEQTGWLGRVANRYADPDRGNVPAAFVGRIPPPVAMHARETIVPVIREAKDWTLSSSLGVPVIRPGRVASQITSAGREKKSANEDAACPTFASSSFGVPGQELPAANAACFGLSLTSAAFASAQRTAGVLKAARGLAYPELPLAQSFQTVAQLIRADLGLRIFLVEQGGVSPRGVRQSCEPGGEPCRGFAAGAVAVHYGVLRRSCA